MPINKELQERIEAKVKEKLGEGEEIKKKVEEKVEAGKELRKRIEEKVKEKLEKKPEIKVVPKPVPPKPEPLAKVINFLPADREVPSLAKEEVTHIVPLTGRIVNVILHFGDGCDGLLEARVYYKSPGDHIDYIVPEREDDFIVLNNTTKDFYPNTPVASGGQLIAEWRNHDNTYGHKVAAICVVTKTKEAI